MSPLMKPVKGLYAVTPDLADTALLIAKVEMALGAGARWLQYRNKAADEGLRRQQATALRDLCRRHGAMLIINDDAALAAEIDADGVHVGAEDAAITVARALLGRDKIIGASCYDSLSRAQTAAAQGADYIAFGSFFASSVKPGAVRAPLSLLPAARAFRLPVIAIGGITLDNADQLITAGADAIAVISALFTVPDIAVATKLFCQLFQAKTI
jgi:thiamine-phosphate pyrophosphorylase